MHRQIILFDTEYTAWQGSQARKWSEPWEHREIIQIAAARIEVYDGVSELESFDRLVKPSLNPVLSPYIIELTGIQQAAIETRGVSFAEAFSAFYAFSEQGCVPLFCWGDDPAILQENLTLNEMACAPFPAGIYDIRVLFEHVGIDTRRYSSGTVHQAVGAEFKQAAHNALNDVRSLAATIRYLVRTGQLGAAWVQAAMLKAKFPNVI